MKNSLKQIIKQVVVSLLTLIVGFISMTIPFNLLNTLPSNIMQIIFISEIILYAILFSLFFIIKEKHEKEKIKKQKIKLNKQKRRIQLLKELEQFNTAA